jgi:glycosyltransferase involved in cell wall biosynthesis
MKMGTDTLSRTPIKSVSHRFTYGPQIHGSIPPVNSGGTRPFWSVVIPTHNCARYLETTLQSVLVQDPGPAKLEITVVDDHSTKDDPQEVVQRLAGDRVRFIRQAENVGKARNYETGISQSRGYWIHQLHGDDLVKPGFYDSMEHAICECPEAAAAFCESEYIDADGNVTGRTGCERESIGILENWLSKIYTSQRIQTPSIVVRRDVYERLGGFDRRLKHAEDWEMWIRIALHYSFAFNPSKLAQYRVHSSNSSVSGIQSGSAARVAGEVFRIVDDYIPREIKQECSVPRARHMAYQFVSWLPRAIRSGGIHSWLRLSGTILHYHFSLRIIYHIFRISLNEACTAGGTKDFVDELG